MPQNQTDKPQPTQPEDLKWPEGGSVRDHARYLIEARQHVASQDVPEGFRQRIHSDAESVGDPHKPAIVDASYDNNVGDRKLVSIAYPASTSQQTPIELGPGGARDSKRNTGFSPMNNQDSLKALLEAYDVEIIDQGKMGYDGMKDTQYIEFEVESKADYEKGRAIIDAYTRSNETDPDKLLQDIDAKLEAKGFTVDRAKSVNLADNVRGVKAAQDALKTGKIGSKLGKLTVVGGIAVAGGIGGVIHYCHEQQRDLAKNLMEQGHFGDMSTPEGRAKSQEVYDDYIKLNKEVETEMQIENAASQGWFFVATTPVVEASASQKYEDFIKKHGLNLPEDIHKSLGMSLIDGKSPRGQFADVIIESLPEKPEDAPENLRSLVEAKNELNKAKAEKGYALSPANRGGGVSVKEADENLQKAQEAYNAELKKVFSDSVAAKELVDRIPQNEMIEMTDAIARSTVDDPSVDIRIREIGELQKELDEIKSEGKKHGEADNDYLQRINSRANRINEIKADLENSPEVIKEFIIDRMSGKQSSQPTNEVKETTQNMSSSVEEGRKGYVNEGQGPLLTEIEKEPDPLVSPLIRTSNNSLDSSSPILNGIFCSHNANTVCDEHVLMVAHQNEAVPLGIGTSEFMNELDASSDTSIGLGNNR